MENKQLITIVGPTGAGKTAVSIALAKHFSTEIISSDSRQIYKGLTIGTAAVRSDEQQGIPHHFVGVLEITERFNAFEFEKKALKVIEQCFHRHDTLIMCGGSMMYIDAVCKGIDEMPDVDLNIRNKLKNRVEEEGLYPILEELKAADITYYNDVDKKNPSRVIHGLEVFLTTGKPISSFRRNAPKKRPFQIKKIGITLPREELYRRINQRVDKMIEEGLMEEARRYYPLRACNALKTLAYRELFDYFAGKISFNEAIRLIKRNSRHYAKKQLTWFRKDENVLWFAPNEVEKIIMNLR